MDPIVGGALIAAGSNILGGLLGSKSESKSLKLQRDWNMNRIRYTVEDARRAGVHPLFALGASVGTQQLTQTGGAISQGVGRAGEAMARGVAQSQIEANKAQALKDIAEAQLAEARASATTRSASNDKVQLFSDAVGSAALQGPTRTELGVVDVVPSQVTTTTPGAPDTAAGRNPFWKRIVVGGSEIRVPDERIMEAAENPIGGAVILKELYGAGRTKGQLERAIRAENNAVKRLTRQYLEAERSGKTALMGYYRRQAMIAARRSRRLTQQWERNYRSK